jgi:nucleotide-binding universal stress UspA family protein
MIKTILVPTTGSATDTKILDTALFISRPLQAHLKFLHVRLSAGAAAVQAPGVDFCAEPAISDIMRHLERQQADLSAAASAHVATFCATNHIALRSTPGLAPEVTAEVVEETDHAEARILMHARYTDLLVLGRPERTHAMRYDLIEKLLLGSGRPILMAPDSLPTQPFGTVLLVWQDTPAAARALSAALPLMRQARRIVILNVGEVAVEAQNNLDQVAKHLRWHGIFAETRFLFGSIKTSAELLLQATTEFNPSLMVVGAYSQRPLHEAILGGVTVSLLAHAHVPIFMMH